MNLFYSDILEKLSKKDINEIKIRIAETLNKLFYTNIDINSIEL